MPKSEPTWMRPAESVVLLSPALGDDDAARRLLAGRLKDGTVSASCKYLTMAADVGRVPHVYVDEAPVHACDDPDTEIVPLDSGFPTVSEDDVGTRYVYWESGPPRLMTVDSIANLSSNWAQDVEGWDWKHGTFVFRQPPIFKGKAPDDLPLRFRFGTRTVMYGVRFSQADVLQIVEVFGRQNKLVLSSASSPVRKRRLSRVADWTEINLQLAALAYVGNLDEQLGVRFQDPGWDKATREWIATRLNAMDVYCDPTTIQSEVDRIAEAIRRERSRLNPTPGVR